MKFLYFIGLCGVTMLFLCGCEQKPSIVQVAPDPNLIIAALFPQATQWEVQLPPGQYDLSLFQEESVLQENDEFKITMKRNVFSGSLSGKAETSRKIKVLYLPPRPEDEYGTYSIKTDSSTMSARVNRNVFDRLKVQEDETSVSCSVVSNSFEPISVDEKIQLYQYNFQGKVPGMTIDSIKRRVTLYLRLTKR